MTPEIEWDVVDEVEWGIEEDIVWEETEEGEETIFELRNDSQPSFFVRKFAVVWWRNGFFKAGKVDGLIRVTPTRILFFDEKGKQKRTWFIKTYPRGRCLRYAHHKGC